MLTLFQVSLILATDSWPTLCSLADFPKDFSLRYLQLTQSKLEDQGVFSMWLQVDWHWDLVESTGRSYVGLGRPGSQSWVAVSATEVSYTTEQGSEGPGDRGNFLGFFPPQALAPAVYRAKKMKGLNASNCQRTLGGLLLEAGAPVLWPVTSCLSHRPLQQLVLSISAGLLNIGLG